MSAPETSTMQEARKKRELRTIGIGCGVEQCDAHPVERPKEQRSQKPLSCRLGIHSHWRFKKYPEDWSPPSGEEGGDGPKAPPPPPASDYMDGGSQAICLACGTEFHTGRGQP